MDKNAIKKYAVWARRELIERVSQKALQYGITADGKADPNADSVNGRVFSDAEKSQRQALIRKVNAQGYEQVMEEVAYTWFNRFAALRFMEVNGYLPSHVRVFTNDTGEFKPQILSEAIHLDLDGLDMDRVYELKNANKEEELFKYLLIVQCNALNRILPGMFQKIEDYTELLLPDYLLREGSVIERMVNQEDGIPEQDWTDQVQIIGWLYQYYNTEPKDKVFADLKKNVKITKENIPAATQLFTPDWIVRYMVENSLGRLWLEGHPNDTLKSEWKYYLDEAEQEEEVQKQLEAIRKECAALKPEDIRCIDPCMGSGHILCYMFDVLVRIYEDYGHSAREAATSIIENNLWGLDIDERAAQLSYFAVMMKARQYDRRFFSKKDENGNLAIPQPHVYAVAESNTLDSYAVEYFVDGRPELKSAMDTLMKELHDAKEYGSILTVTPQDWSALYARFAEVEHDISIHRDTTLQQLKPFVQAGQALAQKYHVVVTNPPYMSNKGMSAKMIKFVQKKFPDSKADLFAIFMEQCEYLMRKNGLQAMITQHSWMFLSSFEKLRSKMLNCEMINMAHLGARAFEEIGGEVVQTTSFVRRKGKPIPGYYASYARLVEGGSQDEKEKMFLSHDHIFTAKQQDFSLIPGAPVAYWQSKAFFDAFAGTLLNDKYETKKGMFTGNNDYFLKMWYEVPFRKIGDEFRSYNKGGGYRRWYGHNDVVVRWHNNGIEIKNAPGSGNINESYFFETCLSWNLVSTAPFCCRIVQKNNVMGDAGPICLIKETDGNYFYVLAYLNSVVCNNFMSVLNPTMNYPSGVVGKLPLIIIDGVKDKIIELSKACVDLARNDWDAFETSWGFTNHPLASLASERQEQLSAGMNHEARAKAVTLLSERYRRWEEECEYRFSELKKNEEELNRIFIDIYGLQDELSPEVEDKDVTVRKADLQRDIRSLLSYAVGCMFGRYSLDVPGLVYAGGTWDASKYTTFRPDKDAIIPICDDEYFDDDIVGRFVKFVEVVYGKETLEENLKFIADALGGRGTSREVIRNYFLNDFYADHLKVYQKRPIYWLFDSGKKNGFKCLVYMHRYQPDTIARIRTDYVHEQQSRYRTAIADLEQRINGVSTSERVKLNKQLTTLQAQATEIRTYEEKIHHLADQMISIDLDDGVKVNYAKFADVLAKIK